VISVRRFLGFVLDLGFILGIVLGIGSFISWYGLIETGSLTAFIFLWGCFFYFAVLNWHPGKTLGKYAVGLELVSLRQGRVGLLKSIARTFVGLLLPIFLAGWIFQQIPEAPSKFEWIGLSTLTIAVFFVIPISIAVGKGTTGCHDLVFGCGVLSARGRNSAGIVGRNLTRHLGLTVLISLLAGAVTAVAMYGVGFGQMWVKPQDRKASLPAIYALGSTVKDPCDIFSLHVAEGLNNAAQYIVGTSCYVEPNDLQIDKEPFPVDNSVEQLLKEQQGMFVFEVKLSPALKQRTLVKEFVLSNFRNVARELGAEIDHPIFLGLRFTTETKYGLFDLADLETLLLMVAAPQNEGSELLYFPSQRGRETSLNFLDLRDIRRIMLGNLRPQDWRR